MKKILLCVCCALLCSLFAVRCAIQVHSSVRCHLFLFTHARICLKNMTRSRREASPTASGGEPRCTRPRRPRQYWSSDCAKGTHREAPTASIHGHGDASVFGPNDADRRGAPVLRVTGFTNEPPQFEATTITRAHPGSCMTIRSEGCRHLSGSRNRSPGA